MYVHHICIHLNRFFHNTSLNMLFQSNQTKVINSNKVSSVIQNVYMIMLWGTISSPGRRTLQRNLVDILCFELASLAVVVVEVSVVSALMHTQGSGTVPFNSSKSPSFVYTLLRSRRYITNGQKTTERTTRLRDMIQGAHRSGYSCAHARV